MTDNLQENVNSTPSTEEAAPKQNPRKGFYILPNLFTLAAIFGGFYAVVMAVNGDFKSAALGIFCAMILDGLDGRVARLTGTASEFGEQFDSLSDMVSFGAAPALVVYIWALEGLGKWGWVAAFVYCACGALRLARFNTNIGVVDKRFFQGLPSPSAAAIVASFVWMIHAAEYEPSSAAVWALFVTLFAGLTMVSNIPFYSFKQLNTRKSVSFFKVAFFVLMFALILALIVQNPPITLFVIFMGYGLSGYLIYAYHWFKGNKINVVQAEESQEGKKDN